MRTKNRLRKTLIAWVASYLVALNAIVGAAAPFANASPDIGLSEICHSAGGEAQKPLVPGPHLMCDHCAICAFSPAVTLPNTSTITIARTSIPAWRGA